MQYGASSCSYVQCSVRVIENIFLKRLDESPNEVGRIRSDSFYQVVLGDFSNSDLDNDG